MKFCRYLTNVLNRKWPLTFGHTGHENMQRKKSKAKTETEEEIGTNKILIF